MAAQVLLIDRESIHLQAETSLSPPPYVGEHWTVSRETPSVDANRKWGHRTPWKISPLDDWVTIRHRFASEKISKR
jgi:hypothetical protein